VARSTIDALDPPAPRHLTPSATRAHAFLLAARFTGGGRGIGRATALELPARGVLVAVAARSTGALEELDYRARQGRNDAADIAPQQACGG
jgi:short-subunit dehydrogenase involved in D-alanine esterification of teichoic acids